MNKTGFLLISKPAGISSYGVIAQIKKIIGKKSKIGHAGTLDPFATGLLVVAIGREATKQLSHLLGAQKKYVAKGQLGMLTDTLDSDGTVEKEDTTFETTQKIVENAVQSFKKTYTQTPPIYSALKHQGKPLYKLARSGKKETGELEKIVTQKAREVSILKIELLSFEHPFFEIKTRVSSGTYIRVLVNDIAQKIGTCATTVELKRTGIGKLSLAHAVQLEQLKSVDDIEKHLIDSIL